MILMEPTTRVEINPVQPETPTVAEVMDAAVTYAMAEVRDTDGWMQDDSPAVRAYRNLRRLVERMYDGRFEQGIRALEGGTR